MSNYPILKLNNTAQPRDSFYLRSIENILLTEHATHSPYDFHQIEFFVFILYTEGSEIHTVGFKDYECKKGTLLAIRKGQIHKFSNPSPKGTILVFNYDFLGEFFTKDEAQKSLLLFNDFLSKPKIQLNEDVNAILLNIINQIKDEYINRNDTYSPSIIRSLLQVFISHLTRFYNENTSILVNKKYLIEFIEFQNLVEERFTQSLKVKDYANWLGYSVKTLNTITKSIVNITAKKFIDEVCINSIKRKLLSSNQSVKEICYELGFEETTNFNNYFKRHTGKTPQMFRKC